MVSLNDVGEATEQVVQLRASTKHLENFHIILFVEN